MLTFVSCSDSPHSAAISMSVVPSGCLPRRRKFSSSTATWSSDRLRAFVALAAMSAVRVASSTHLCSGATQRGTRGRCGCVRGRVRVELLLLSTQSYVTSVTRRSPPIKDTPPSSSLAPRGASREGKKLEKRPEPRQLQIITQCCRLGIIN